MSFWERMFGSGFAEFDQRQEKREPAPKLDFAPFRTPDAIQQLAAQQQQLAEEQRRQYQALQQLNQYPQQALGSAGYYQQGNALAGAYNPPLPSDWSRQLFNNVTPAPISKPKPAPRVPELNLDNVREISLEEDS